VSPTDGRITIVVPVFQCRDRLASHIEFLKSLCEIGPDFIWVATQSSDDSHLLSQEAARGIGGKYLEVPAGLYSAWNRGIQEVQTEFTYISTVGEFITPEGLLHMRTILSALRADLCFSPPRIYPSNKRSTAATRHWPVFQHSKLLSAMSGKILPISIAAHLQALSGHSCLLGSCSSILFRTECIRENPFPNNYLHYGDTAWFYNNLCHLKIAFIDNVFSTFHVHDFSSRSVSLAHLQTFMEVLATDYQKIYPSSPFPSLVLDLMSARQALDHLREPHPYRFWWMDWHAWLWRFKRALLTKQIHQHLFKYSHDFNASTALAPVEQQG